MGECETMEGETHGEIRTEMRRGQNSMTRRNSICNSVPFPAVVDPDVAMKKKKMCRQGDCGE